MAKILVAIDDSEQALGPVRYIAKLIDKSSEIILFSVIPDVQAICEMESPELIPYFRAHQAEFCSMEDKKKELVKTNAQRAREILIRAGFGKDRIDTKIIKRKKGIAADILEELESGQYDLVVASTKGKGQVGGFIFGSVSYKLLAGAVKRAVLLVGDVADTAGGDS